MAGWRKIRQDRRNSSLYASRMTSDLQTATLLAHADGNGEASIAPPIYQTANFRAINAEDFSSMATDPRHDQFYTRYGNPTLSRAETIIAKLEGAQSAMLTASGMGAISTAMFGLLEAGDHVVAQESLYGGTSGFLQNVLPRFGITVTLVDQTDVNAFANAMQPNTRLMMLETPTNPLMKLTDLNAVSEIAQDHNAIMLVDGTIASPINQRPLEFGVDLVMHSATKYLGGHSDLSAGVLAGSKALIERIWQTSYLMGATLNAIDGWLLLRGLRTLKLRVEQQNKTALEIAAWLEAHPCIRTVHYVGLASHPQHDLARAQMTGFGGVLSFEIDGDFAATDQFISRLELASRAASFGSIGALVVHPAAMWAGMMTPEQLAATSVQPSLVRYGVGLEDVEDLKADIAQALEAIT
jgi:cystathionine beta-lyase/cystathionine gamma-synthase